MKKRWVPREHCGFQWPFGSRSRFPASRPTVLPANPIAGSAYLWEPPVGTKTQPLIPAGRLANFDLACVILIPGILLDASPQSAIYEDRRISFRAKAVVEMSWKFRKTFDFFLSRWLVAGGPKWRANLAGHFDVTCIRWVAHESRKGRVQAVP